MAASNCFLADCSSGVNMADDDDDDEEEEDTVSAVAASESAGVGCFSNVPIGRIGANSMLPAESAAHSPLMTPSTPANLAPPPQPLPKPIPLPPPPPPPIISDDANGSGGSGGGKIA